VTYTIAKLLSAVLYNNIVYFLFSKLHTATLYIYFHNYCNIVYSDYM